MTEMNTLSTDHATGILDVEDLLGRCLGNLEFAQRVLNKFQERGDEDLNAMEMAVFAGDSDTVARLAHRMKGASANASASRLRDCAAEIEHAARHESLDNVPRGLQGLRQEWTRFGEVVSQLESFPEASN